MLLSARDLSLFKIGASLTAELKALPLVRAHRLRNYERSFAFAEGCFLGVFRSFEDASLCAPPGKSLGFDRAEYAKKYRERLESVYAYDYPILYWLSQVLTNESTLFDLGGHIGIHFVTFKRYLEDRFPALWTICDVLEVVEAGRRLAIAESAKGLEFTTTIAHAANADVLFSAGAIQYIESPSFLESLAALDRRPPHVLLNKVPVHDRESFVTLQNIGTGFAPLHCFKREAFVSAFSDLGYELVDSWKNPEYHCQIPFHPEFSVSYLSGFYFRSA